MHCHGCARKVEKHISKLEGNKKYTRTQNTQETVGSKSDVFYFKFNNLEFKNINIFLIIASFIGY